MLPPASSDAPWKLGPLNVRKKCWKVAGAQGSAVAANETSAAGRRVFMKRYGFKDYELKTISPIRLWLAGSLGEALCLENSAHRDRAAWLMGDREPLLETVPENLLDRLSVSYLESLFVNYE
ncbi:hypothetical protein R1flu_004266 [Riccia fluitans]|uniref:Uncharacterized protein n=1 Tax=Riccia fluitans TaxID=41844 RepID=A0ABD1YSU3_9MARC